MLGLYLLDLSSPSLSAWTSSVALGLLTWFVCYVVNFYVQTRDYPPGPLPLPLLGNFYLFLNGGHGYKNVLALRQKYGSIFTVWMGSTPCVLLCDLKDGIEAFKDKKDEFAGKQWPGITETILGEEGSDVILSDNTRDWEALRKLMHSAVRKFTISDTLPELVSNVVDETLQVIKDKHMSKAFDPIDYSYLMVYNILAQTAYGQRYSPEDKEFVQLKDMNSELLRVFPTVLVADLLPFTRPFLYQRHRYVTRVTREFRQMVIGKYNDHLATYEEGTVRDFCDALIAAKNEAQAEQKATAPYLTDTNLSLTLLDLFVAGTDTTRVTSTWIILFLANFPNWQAKLRDEVEDIVGDELPNHEHRTRCHLLSAFLSETLRFRPVVPINIGHQATVDSTIGGFPIKKGTSVSLVQESYLHDPQLWDRPLEFEPSRFLDKDGHHCTKITGFHPFGVGRRACVGEKLAQSTLFFLTCRLLQSTRGHRLVLPDGPGSVDMDGDTSQRMVLAPVPYKVMLVPDERFPLDMNHNDTTSSL